MEIKCTFWFVLFFVFFQVHGMNLGRLFNCLPAELMSEIQKFILEKRTFSALRETCKANRDHLDKEFLKLYVSDIKDEESKKVPLVFAAKENHCYAFKRIWRIKSTEVNKADKYGFTPLYLFAFCGNTELVKVLLEHQADVNKADTKYRKIPLHWAVYNGHTEVVRLLLKHNADTNKPDREGNSPLFVAVQKDNTNIVRLLLEHKADANTYNYDSLEPLFWAAKKGYTEIVELLLKHGASVGTHNYKCETALHFASKKGYTDIVSKLLEKGANVNDANLFGQTPLLWAVWYNRIEVVKVLLEHKANVNKKNDGETLLECAVNMGHTEIANLLREHGAEG